MEDGEIEDEGMVIEISNLKINIAAELRSKEKSPYEMLKDSKSSIEEMVAQILDMKNKQPNPQLRQLFTQIFLHLITLRQANRCILIGEDRVKSETERAKAPVDMTTLQLHNLLYEKSHYLKAIKACKDFKSKYSNIELVPEEEFSCDAPRYIKTLKLSDNASHDLMIKRLNYELYQV